LPAGWRRADYPDWLGKPHDAGALPRRSQMVEPKELSAVKELSCVSKYEHGNMKTVHAVRMKVTRVTKKNDFPDPN
jgi:hypothetical protein